MKEEAPVTPCGACVKGRLITLPVEEENPATLGIEEGVALLQVTLCKRNCVNILDNDSKLTSSALASDLFDEFL